MGSTLKYEIHNLLIYSDSVKSISLNRDNSIYLIFIANAYKHGVLYIIETGNRNLNTEISLTSIMPDNFFTLTADGITTFKVTSGNVDGRLSAIRIDGY